MPLHGTLNRSVGICDSSSVTCHPSFDREHQHEGAAPTLIAQYLNFGLMTYRDVLDDRQTKAGSARFTRAAAVDAVKTFSQTRDVLR